MAPSPLYLETVVSRLSSRADQTVAPEGTAILSLETQEQEPGFEIVVFVEENFPAFLENLRHLNGEDQDYCWSITC